MGHEYGNFHTIFMTQINAFFFHRFRPMKEAMKNPMKKRWRRHEFIMNKLLGFHGFWVYGVPLQRIAYMPAKNTCIDNMRHNYNLVCLKFSWFSL